MRAAAAFWGALILGLGLGSWIGVPAAGAAVVAPPAGAIVVGTTSSATCPSPTFATINAAIDAATTPVGATIYVCAGTYPEAVSVTKNVTLLGAQWGVPATAGRTDPSQETTIDNPAGTDVTYNRASTGTLSGFSLIGNGKGAGDDNGIVALQAGQSGFTWTDNIITGTSTGINFEADGITPTTISDNRITGNTEAGGSELSNGIFFTNGPANNVTISRNVFGDQGADFNTTGSGNTADLSRNLVVTDNTSVDSQNFAVLFLTNNAVISHNTIGWTNPHDPMAETAIYLSGSNINPTIDANTISGGAATGIGVNADFYSPSSAVTVTNNTIVNRLNGVRVSPDAGLTATSSITGNAVTDAGVGDGVGPEVPGGNGIWLQSGTGVVVSGNAASGSVTTDCRDETTGPGTAGTANAWTLDTGITSSPPGLCVAPAISLVKTADPSSVQRAGQLVTYSFLVTNNGNGPLSGISVADTFTAPSTGSLTAACPATTLAAGASMTCTATYAVTQADIDNGVINDSATATGTPASGPAVTSAASIASVSVVAGVSPSPPKYDLAITKTTSTKKAIVGQRVTYTIVVRNFGPDAAPAVKVIDTSDLPTKILSVRTTAGTCTAGVPLECLLGTINASARVTITVVSSPTKPGTLRNAVSVTSTGQDTNPENSLAVAVVTVHRLVALRLHKRASSPTALPGADMTYRMTVTNPNFVAVRRVTVCDTLPAGEQFASARPAAHRSGERYCWTIDRLTADATKHLELTVNISTRHGGRLVNHATAEAHGLPTSHAAAAVAVGPVPAAQCASASPARADSVESNPVARAAC